MDAQAVWIDRVPLLAGQKTPIYPTRGSWRVLVGADSTGLLAVHTTDENDAHYVRIGAGYERLFELRRDVMQPNRPAFWLVATTNGEAVLIWS